MVPAHAVILIEYLVGFSFITGSAENAKSALIAIVATVYNMCRVIGLGHWEISGADLSFKYSTAQLQSQISLKFTEMKYFYG